MQTLSLNSIKYTTAAGVTQPISFKEHVVGGMVFVCVVDMVFVYHDFGQHKGVSWDIRIPLLTLLYYSYVEYKPRPVIHICLCI